MDEKILEHLKLLAKYVNLLKRIAKTKEEEFVKDFVLTGSAERYLQLAIESCINIGNRLISILQFTHPVSTPESYTDIFIELERLGVVDKDFLQELIKMVRFRNRLVHLY